MSDNLGKLNDLVVNDLKDKVIQMAGITIECVNILDDKNKMLISFLQKEVECSTDPESVERITEFLKELGVWN